MAISINLAKDSIPVRFDQTRLKPQYITPDEETRRTNYIIRNAYNNPGINGLYRTKITSDETYLYDIREWTVSAKNVALSYPPLMWAAWNPVPKIVSIDAAALLNDFKPEGIVIPSSGELTKFVQKCLSENEHERLWMKLWTLTGSMGDAYIRVVEDARKESGIKLIVYPPDCVFPVLDDHEDNHEVAFKIYYRKKVWKEVNVIKKIFVDTIPADHYEVLHEKGQTFMLDDQIVDEYTFDWPKPLNGRLPMVHFSHNFCDDYYGIPAITGDVLDSIDHINYMYTSVFDRFRKMFFEHTWSKNYSVKTQTGKGGLPLGRSFHHDLGNDGELGTFSFPIDTGYLTAIKDCLESVKEQLPHYTVERFQASKEAMTKESMQARMGTFLSYEKSIEANQRPAIRKLVNIILRVAGKHSGEKDLPIDVELGEPFDEAISGKLEELQSERELVGDGPTMRKRITKRLQMSEEEATALESEYTEQATRKRAMEDEELDRKYPANTITKRLAQKQREKAKAEPVTDKVEEEKELAKLNVYQMVKAMEVDAATAVDLRMAMFDEDEATARRRVEENKEFNLAMAEAHAKKIEIEKGAEAEAKASTQPKAGPAPPGGNPILAKLNKGRPQEEKLKKEDVE